MLRGTSVTLRPFDSTELDQHRLWINDRDIMFFLNRAYPVSDLEHQKWYEKVIGDDKTVFFSIFENVNNTHIGAVWIWNIDYRNRNAEIRIFIGEKKLWGAGAGSEALKLISNYAFNELGLHKIYAYVHRKNPRGKLAFEKSGFAVEGELLDEFFCDGSFEDVYRLAMLSRHSAPAPQKEQDREIQVKGFEGSSFQWFKPKS